MLWINMQCERKLPVPLQACALFVALERLLQVALSMPRGVALCLLLDSLAFARDEEFLRAWLLFFARLWEVARCRAWVAADTELLATRLRAWIFAFARPMTLLLALVRPASESTSAYFAAARFVEPARLVLENALSAQAGLGRQVSAFGAFLVIDVAAVVELRMPAVLGSLAREAAWWRLSAAREWWLQNGAAAVAAQFVKHGITAGSTGAFVTKLLALMLRVTALQLAATSPSTYVLGLEIVAWLTRCRVQWPCLSTVRLPLSGLLLACTATLSAFMAAAVQ